MNREREKNKSRAGYKRLVLTSYQHRITEIFFFFPNSFLFEFVFIVIVSIILTASVAITLVLLLLLLLLLLRLLIILVLIAIASVIASMGFVGIRERLRFVIVQQNITPVA